jgi:hypothetical protein
MKQLYPKEVIVDRCKTIIAKHAEATNALREKFNLKSAHKWRVLTKKIRAYSNYIETITPSNNSMNIKNADLLLMQEQLLQIKKLYKITGEYRARELFLSEIDLFEPLLQEHTHRVVKHIKKEAKYYHKEGIKQAKKYTKKYKLRHKKIFTTRENLLKPHPITNMTHWWRTYQRDIMWWIAQTVHQGDDIITIDTMHDIRKQSKKMMYVSNWIEATQSEYIPMYQSRSDELWYVNDAADRILYLEAYMKKIGIVLPHVNRYHAAHDYDKEQVLEHFRYFFKI